MCIAYAALGLVFRRQAQVWYGVICVLDIREERAGRGCWHSWSTHKIGGVLNQECQEYSLSAKKLIFLFQSWLENGRNGSWTEVWMLYGYCQGILWWFFALRNSIFSNWKRASLHTHSLLRCVITLKRTKCWTQRVEMKEIRCPVSQENYLKPKMNINEFFTKIFSCWVVKTIFTFRIKIVISVTSFCGKKLVCCYQMWTYWSVKVPYGESSSSSWETSVIISCVWISAMLV